MLVERMHVPSAPSGDVRPSPCSGGPWCGRSACESTVPAGRLPSVTRVPRRSATWVLLTVAGRSTPVLRGKLAGVLWRIGGAGVCLGVLPQPGAQAAVTASRFRRLGVRGQVSAAWFPLARRGRLLPVSSRGPFCVCACAFLVSAHTGVAVAVITSVKTPRLSHIGVRTSLYAFWGRGAQHSSVPDGVLPCPRLPHKTRRWFLRVLVATASCAVTSSTQVELVSRAARWVGGSAVDVQRGRSQGQWVSEPDPSCLFSAYVIIYSYSIFIL